MKKHFSIYTLILVLALFQLNETAYAQNQQSEGQQNSSESNFGLTQISSLGGLYIVDQIGLQIARNALPYERSIDTNTYILGPNDVISISIAAIQPLVLRGTIINIQGDIVLPSTGAVEIAGLTIPEAEKKIAEHLKDQLKDFTVDISLDNPRPLNITVTGPIPHPGKYIVPTQARVDVAISQAITSGNRDLTRAAQFSSEFSTDPNYSFRNIIIKRASGAVDTADLVGYYRTGDLSKNPIVRDGDRILLDRLFRESPKISISGSVRTDLELEYNASDTPHELIDIAGGYEVEADTTRIYLYRNVDGETQMMEVARENWDSIELRPNDRLIAPFNREPNSSSSAWVYGEVQITGNFPVISGVTSAQRLLELAGGLTSEALPSAAQLLRTASLENEIPNKFNADLMKRTSNQLAQGLEYLDAETKLSENRVFIDLNNEEELKAIKIFDGDRLFVPRDEETVFVFGQVNNTGYYPFIPDYSVQNYITKAGGFALSADRERIFIIKAGNNTWYRPSETDLSSGDKIFVDRQPVEELNALRAYEIQKAQLRNQRTQLVMTAITTITGIITTYVAIQNIRN